MLEIGTSAGPRHQTAVIAEIGTNHVGDADLARRMVTEAVAAGADVVSVSEHLEPTADVDAEPGQQLLEKVSLSVDTLRELAKLAAHKGATFTSSPTTVTGARLLVEELRLRTIRVESSEMLNLELLDYLDGRVDTIYLGTGLARLEEVRLAVSRLRRTSDVVVMHCVDEYPLAPCDANLSAIGTLARTFPSLRVGYLDHTIGLLAPLVAVALGATVIEKHFTLDRSLPGTDHVVSVTPTELGELIHGLRQTESLLGTIPEPTVERPHLALASSKLPAS